MGRISHGFLNPSRIKCPIAGEFYSTDTRSLNVKENKLSILVNALNELDIAVTPPTTEHFVSILRLCTSCKALSHGKAVHSHIIRSVPDAGPVLGGLLVQMYSDCGAFPDACDVFSGIRSGSVFAWNVIVRAYTMHGHGAHALAFLPKMLREGFLPDKISFITMLSTCSQESNLAEGRRFHFILNHSSLSDCVMLQNSLLNMYARSESLGDVWKLFGAMSERNVISWTSSMAAFLMNGLGHVTCHLFGQMQQEGVLPDKLAFLSMLDACASGSLLLEGEKVHACIVSSRLDSDTVLGTSLINMYNKCGSPNFAIESFESIAEKNLVSWTAIIEMHARHEQHKEAIMHFDRMQLEGINPNRFTVVNVLDALGNKQQLLRGKQIHAMVFGSNFESDPPVDAAIINMYGKCNRLDDARTSFDNSTERDIVLWTSLIAVHAQNNQGELGLKFFSRMLEDGVIPNRVTFVTVFDACAGSASLHTAKQLHVKAIEMRVQCNLDVGSSIIDMYGKCGSLENARQSFDLMAEKDNVTWNSIINTYAHHGHGKAVLELFHQMYQQSVPIDEVTFLTVISSCSHTGLVDEGLGCFALMYRKHGIAPLVRHYNTLIDLLGRAGKLDEAENLIGNMQPGPDVVTLGTLLGAYRRQLTQ